MNPMKIENEGVSISPRLSLKGESGVKVDIDLSDISATDAQKQTLRKLFQTGKITDLNENERKQIKDLKALVKAGSGPSAFVCRFDLTWVRID